MTKTELINDWEKWIENLQKNKIGTDPISIAILTSIDVIKMCIEQLKQCEG